MIPFPKPCGRLDHHDEHQWTRPASLDRPARDYLCSGRILVEGGWWLDWNADEAAEDDKREDELDRQIRDRLAGGWTGDAA